MRFSKIELPAYGPFSDFSLSFPRQSGDFQIIHGPNEAGKSSLLRAIRGLLYGIPERTADVFLHPAKNLRIVAEIEAEGQRHHLQRRKGRINTLLDVDGNALGDTYLADLLGAVDEAYFNTLFGLGSDELRTGSTDLLAGKGRLGEALFSASMGGTPVEQVIAQLEAEADELFSGRAQRRIRLAIKERNTHLEQAKHSFVKADDWEHDSQALTDTRDELKRLTEKKSALATRQAWLTRCADALPNLGELREAERALAALPTLPTLADNFGARVRELISDSATAGQQIRETETTLQSQKEKAAKKNPDPAVLAQASQIEALQRDAGANLDKEARLQKLESEGQRLRREIDQTRDDLGIPLPTERLGELKITAPERDLAASRAKAATETARELRELTQRANEARHALETLTRDTPDYDSERLNRFEEVCARAERIRETAANLPERRRALDRTKAERANLCRKLGHGSEPADLAKLAGYQPPKRARIDQFAEQFTEAKLAISKQESRLAETRSEMRSLRAEIEEHERIHNLPTEELLKTTRSERDKLSQRIAESWKDSLPYDPSLITDQEKHTSEADEHADRLIRDAETVARIRESQIRISSLLTREAEAKAAHERETEALDKNRVAWKSAWQGIVAEPASAVEMREWIDLHDQFIRIHSQVTEETTELEQASTEVSAVAECLRELCEIDEPTSDFSDLYRAAIKTRDALRAAKDTAAKHTGALEAKSAELRDLEKAIEDARKNAEQAQSAWNALIDPLGIPAELEPADALNLLNRRHELGKSAATLEDLDRETAELQESITQYADRARALAEECGLDPEESPDVLESQLRKLLNTANNESSALDILREQIAATEEKLVQERTRKANLDERLGKELTRAKLEQPADLDTFLPLWESARELRSEIDGARKQLSKLARGEAVVTFIERISAENRDELAAEQATLEEQLRALEANLKETQQREFDLAQRLKAMEQIEDNAARSAQQASLAEEAILEDARRYVRLLSAVRLLRGQVERFREKNQGPFMERAGHWFAQLSGGSFAGLTVSYAESDEPSIAGRRQSGEVPIPGMSEGTRDQLYLALRLAGLELHFRDHPPMPLILDDLLVHFDDERSKHALLALAEMSKQCQVLLFTHHGHLVDLANKTLPKGAFALSELERA